MTLRWYQEEAVDSIWQYFASGKTGNPIVAMPTGTGKSHVQAGFMQKVLEIYPRQRFLSLTHVKELIKQNSEKLADAWPLAPLGIHSDGLGARDMAQPIIFGGVKSVWNTLKRDPQAFGWRDLVFVDECHLISENAESTYGQTLAALKAINPYLKVIGLTATYWRTGEGELTNGNGLFTDICYDLTTMAAFTRLIAEGHIVPLIPKRTHTELDVSNVGMYKGDFQQGALQAAVNKDEITWQALQELVHYGQTRQSWLVFASGIEHAERVAEMLRYMQVPAAAVHSKSDDRDGIIAAFKRGELRCLVNNNIFTTGQDHPPIDLIGMLRPTQSTGLWVQMLGRGMRPCEETGKRDCLVLDFARNTIRLGPINDPIIPKRREGKAGDMPVKICENCGTYNHTSARFCVSCEAPFATAINITKSAGTEELIKSDLPIIEYYDVSRVMYYKRNSKNGDIPMLKVDYLCGMRQFSEFVLLQHPGPVKAKARQWWRQRHPIDPPETVDEALHYQAQLKVPRRIAVWVNKQYPEVVRHEY